MKLQDLFQPLRLLEDFKDTGETLYHKAVGYPPDLTFPRLFNPTSVTLDYGGHAKQAAYEDRYGKLTLPATIDLRRVEIVEVGAVGNTITKVVCRTAFQQRKGIILVLVIMIPSGVVKTVWANEARDSHKTLDRSRYVKPKNPTPMLNMGA
jgi:hypothetical protein